MDDPSPSDTPEGMLDALRDHREWDEAARDAALARLVERFPVERLRLAVRDRLGRLGGADGEAILRLVEAYATPELIDDLAQALHDQPGLPPERAWEALSLLDASGVLEDHPDLAEWWDDLNETFESEDPLGTLAAQLEEDPDGSWVALQGIGAVEPEVRAEIIAGLADLATGPGLVSFLRVLGHAHDPTTRRAAINALIGGHDDDEHRMAWAELARDHPDASVRDRSAQRLGPNAESLIALALEGPRRPRPEAVGSLVTALDGSGRGTIVLASRDRGKWVVASFGCDVWRGVVEVAGQVDDDPGSASRMFEEFGSDEGREVVEDAPELAAGLLGGSLMLCGPETNPVLRYWLERTAGPGFRPRPFAGLAGDPGLAGRTLTMAPEPSWLILDALTDWVDDSGMTYDLAEEIALRSGEAPPDPKRDAGAYRYLFEHRLIGRLEHYRRMLLWMASFWSASGQDRLSEPALSLAWQLSDPQHAVPGHPFTVALTTRSLLAAQAELRAGRDPRRG